jgi:hypothetical protein
MITRGNRKIIRPQFDHWYPKSIYPLLALSFYNLIPSCANCNSIAKGEMQLNTTDHVHPYIDSNQTSEFKFNYFYNKRLDEFRIFLEAKDPGNMRVTKTLKALNIDEMYNTHMDELKDMIKIRQAYSEKYIAQMRNFFPRSGLSPEEVYRLLFGTELIEPDFHKRPLSKFKKDILIKLGFQF